MKTPLKSIKYLILTIYAFPVLVLAQGGGITSLQSLLNFAMSYITILTRIVVVLGTIFFFWGMALFILHAEEEDKEEDKKKMFWGLIVITVMFAIWGIIKFLQVSLFGTVVPGAPTF